MFLSASMLGVETYVILDMIKQVAAGQYPTTQGVIVRSELFVDEGDDTTFYRVRMAYVYSVEGRQYRSDQYRFKKTSSMDEYARSVVDAHPVDRQVVVYYQPDNPANAILSPGLNGKDLWILTGFLGINVILWWMCWHEGRGWWRRRKQAGGISVPVRSPGNNPELRLPHLSPSAWSATVFCLAVLGLSIIVNSTGSTSVEAITKGWIVILVIVALVFLICVKRDRTGNHALTINQDSQTIDVPDESRRMKRAVHFRDVKAVQVETETGKSYKGSTTFTYIVHLAMWNQDHSSSTLLKVADYQDEDEAHAIAEWLRSQI